MKPIIKWVGGKRDSLPKIKELLPKVYNNYYEPFLGGGAVLLDLTPDKAIVGDINPELINMYMEVREHPEEVISYLKDIDCDFNIAAEKKDYYYLIRMMYNHNMGNEAYKQAARFIFLNKHCFNGLYRVNRKGEFNVPFNGKVDGKSADPDHIREVSEYLKKVEFRLGDFTKCLETARAGDFIFLDSPYAPLTATSFTDYTKEGFEYQDHIRLAEIFKDLTDRGCKCMLTNHDTPLIRELYKDYNFTEVDVRRSINRNGDNRKGKEVIITNF